MASIGTFVVPSAPVLCVFPSLKTRFVGWSCALAAAAAKRDPGKRGGRREFTKANRAPAAAAGAAPLGGVGTGSSHGACGLLLLLRALGIKWKKGLRLL